MAAVTAGSMTAVTAPARLRLHCCGLVQGVGFRPLVHRLAAAHGLAGEIENVAGAVRLELQGPRPALEALLHDLPRALPPPGRLEPLQPEWLPPLDPAPAGLRIAVAAPQPLAIGLVAPALVADLAPCASCLAELEDPANRRHGYPFISCAACGPRYSIATAEPYARAHTTLAPFPLCAACAAEFHDPADRRFHAETIGCARCGPRLDLWMGPQTDKPFEGPPGDPLADPLDRACRLLQAGRILALQGVGGFQLLVDATNPQAVGRLRRRKRRPAKPFALLLADRAALEIWIAPHCALREEERELLAGPAAPIVLLRRHSAAEPFPGVAPGSPALGVMLPASPLHHLLARRCGRPLVATSGNRSGEPLCTDPLEARQRLAGIADAFLVHNRPIARPLDDSVLQWVAGGVALLRRARGFAPQALPLALPPRSASAALANPAPLVLACGGDLKCAPALAGPDRLWLAPHLGDLADGRVQERLRGGLEEVLVRHGDRVAALVSDAHPGYGSHQLACRLDGARHRRVPHHLAHGLAVLAEHRLGLPLLVLALDGLGYGDLREVDRGLGASAAPLWGGELLLVRAGVAGRLRVRRLASLRPFFLPGGERAMVEPRRSALGLLAAADPGLLAHPGAAATAAAFLPQERQLLLQAIASGCQAPICSSTGRLFDAVASLLDLVQRLSYEGEGGLRLEGLALRNPNPEGLNPEGLNPGGLNPGGLQEAGAYPLPLRPAALPLGQLDWHPLLRALLADRAAGVAGPLIAARFHRGLAEGWAAAIGQAARRWQLRTVALGGGCFQNRLLLELCIASLRRAGLDPWWGQQIPCNDGGLAAGQVWAALHSLSITKTLPSLPAA